MKSITQRLMASLFLLSSMSCSTQIKNAKTEKVKIYGNCEMCEQTIEKAGHKKQVSHVDWDKDSKMALITYDSTKTSHAEIMRNIALSGYDSEGFLAPESAYKKLPECCQYKRPGKAEEKQEDKTPPKAESTPSKWDGNQVATILDNYFKLKNALVKSDAGEAATTAKKLLDAVNSVKMEKLSAQEHKVWMEVMDALATDAGHISETKDLAHQRDHFASLSKNVYALAKSSKPEDTIYYQNCPMFNDGKGANWLSREDKVRNPYYGSQMLTCGKTVETIK